jgi:hypothetical protein
VKKQFVTLQCDICGVINFGISHVSLSVSASTDL